MRVLAIGAHFDDLELGCGGTLARHVDEGDEVIGLIVSSSEYSNLDGKVLRSGEIAEKEGEEASKIIGYKLYTGNVPTYMIEPQEEIHKKLLEIIESNKIDTIYTHWDGDVHHDHRNLAIATLHVSKHVNRVLMYSSNWYDSSVTFQVNYYVDISETWDRKEQAIRCYTSEMNRVGDSWILYFKNQSLNYGFKNNVKYAEGFKVVKWFR